MRRCCREGVERPSTFLLLVGWDSVQDHLLGFPASPQFTRWTNLLVPFFEESAKVEHGQPSWRTRGCSLTELAVLPGSAARDEVGAG